MPIKKGKAVLFKSGAMKAKVKLRQIYLKPMIMMGADG